MARNVLRSGEEHTHSNRQREKEKKRIKSQKCTYKYAKDVSLITFLCLASIFTSTLSISFAHVLPFFCPKEKPSNEQQQKNFFFRETKTTTESERKKIVVDFFRSCHLTLFEFYVSHTNSVQISKGDQPTTFHFALSRSLSLHMYTIRMLLTATKKCNEKMSEEAKEKKSISNSTTMKWRIDESPK